MKKTSNISLRTAIYVRVSTEEQAQEGFSIRAQTEKLKSYALLKDWEIYDIYSEAYLLLRTIRTCLTHRRQPVRDAPPNPQRSPQTASKSAPPAPSYHQNNHSHQTSQNARLLLGSFVLDIPLFVE